MDKFEKILDKLGLFSIISSFVPGLIIGTDGYLFLLSTKSSENCISKYEFLFIILSLLFGIVFFELGHWFFTYIFKQDRLLFRTINGKTHFQKSNHLSLCKYEYDKVRDYLLRQDLVKAEKDQNVKESYKNVNWEGYRIYNYCKHRVKEHEIDNSTVAMSRTLCVFFLVSTILYVIFHFCGLSSSHIWCFVGVHLFLFVVFLIRTIRNYELMYATVIKEFYQSII